MDVCKLLFQYLKKIQVHVNIFQMYRPTKNELFNLRRRCLKIIISVIEVNIGKKSLIPVSVFSLRLINWLWFRLQRSSEYYGIKLTDGDGQGTGARLKTNSERIEVDVLPCTS